MGHASRAAQAGRRRRADRLELLSLDLPIVVECVETEERIQAVLPELDTMIGGGLITLETVRVIVYRPAPALGALPNP